MSDTTPGAVGVEMLPCPFCGSEEVSMSFSATMDSPKPAHRMVECENCGAMGESFKIEPTSVEFDGDDRYAKIQAIAAWNTRLSTQSPAPISDADVERVASLRAAMLGAESIELKRGTTLIVEFHDISIAGHFFAQLQDAFLAPPATAPDDGERG